MPNELLFLFHTFSATTLLGIAAFMGKEVLFVFLSSCWLFANFFVTKQIELLSWTVTASDVYTIAAFFGTSIVQERYGKEAALQLVRANVFLLVISAVFSAIHLSYIPSWQDTTQSGFSLILGHTPRIVFASIGSFFLSSRLDITLFQWLQTYTSFSFSSRSYMTILCTMPSDTALFTFLGLYGIVDHPWHVFFVSLAVKIITFFLTAPFLTLLSFVEKRYRSASLRFDT